MNLSDIIQRVQDEFGDSAEIQVTKPMIARWATDAQKDIARRVRCLGATEQLSSVDGQVSYAPAFVGGLVEVYRVTYAGIPLTRVSAEYFDINFPQWETTTPFEATQPSYYAMRGNALLIYPAPNAALSNGIKIGYFKLSGTLTSGSAETLEVPELFHEDIVRYCMARAKALDDDLPAFQLNMADYKSRQDENYQDFNVSETGAYPSVVSLPSDYDYGDVDW